MLSLPQTPPELAFRTHCPYCAYQCGMLVGDGSSDAPAGVQGDPHFPVNNGQLCIKGWTATTLLRHPEQLARLRADFDSARASEAETAAAIAATYRVTGEVVCPHTAVGIHAAQARRGPNGGPRARGNGPVGPTGWRRRKSGWPN